MSCSATARSVAGRAAFCAHFTAVAGVSSARPTRRIPRGRSRRPARRGSATPKISPFAPWVTSVGGCGSCCGAAAVASQPRLPFAVWTSARVTTGWAMVETREIPLPAPARPAATHQYSDQRRVRLRRPGFIAQYHSQVVESDVPELRHEARLYGDARRRRFQGCVQQQHGDAKGPTKLMPNCSSNPSVVSVRACGGNSAPALLTSASIGVPSE